MEYRIGRNEDNDLVIPDGKVSGEHAKVDISDDFQSFTLIDLDSTNGTFVNGRRIRSKKIASSDVFKFAHKEQTGVYEKVKSFVLQKRTDFTQEFKELLELESTYKKKRRNIAKNYRLLTMLPRLLITLLVASAILLIPDMNPDIRYPLIMGTSLLGALVSGMGISEKNKEEKLARLKARFHIEFCCPKCKVELGGGGKDGNYLIEKGKCPNTKCNATWHIT